MPSNDDAKLYIPMGVKTEREFFNGFGKKQLKQAIIGTLCFSVIAILFYLFTTNIAFSIVIFLFGAAGSVMMTTKDQSNQSVVEQVKNMVKFFKGQKVFPYIHMKKWSEAGLEK